MTRYSRLFWTPKTSIICKGETWLNEKNDQVELDFEEQDTEVEIEAQASDHDDGDSDENFRKAETATQKRIDRLTKKMREAERREQEAIRYAQAVQSEAQTLKQRMNSMDNNYVTEYTNRVNTQIQQAEMNWLVRLRLATRLKLLKHSGS
jgi:hypothetical protein